MNRRAGVDRGASREGAYAERNRRELADLPLAELQSFAPEIGSDVFAVLTLEAQTIARACGKSHVHNLEPEDLVALTIEAAAMARVPLAGTDWIPGISKNF